MLLSNQINKAAMLHLPLLVLLQSFKYTHTRPTRPYQAPYWRTTSVTDKSFDYWGHGPIYVPGLHKIFTMATKSPDIFPPWLTKSTSETTETTIESTTVTTTTAKVHIDSTTLNTTVTMVTEAPTININTATVEGPTDPFSAFLRKFLRTLSSKSLPELPVLLRPFTQLVTQLIIDGQFKLLDNAVVAYLNTMIVKINEHITTPDKLHTQCYHIYNELAHRQTLGNDTNTLLDLLDNLYDEGEEEDMQKVLQAATGYPNNNATADEIAYGFVHLVFIRPMNRVNGTIKGQTLISMLKTYIANRQTPARRISEDLDDVNTSPNKTYHRIKRSNGITQFTVANLNKIRYNMENIDELVESFNFSSFESSESEYDVKEFYSEIENIEGINVNKKSKGKTKKRQKPQDYIKLKANDDEYTDTEEEQTEPSDSEEEDLQKNIQNIIENYEKLKNVFNSKEGPTHFRGKDYTILIPRHPFPTKIIQKKIPYDSTTKKRRKTTENMFVTSNIVKRKKPRKIDKQTSQTFYIDDILNSATEPSNQAVPGTVKGQVITKNGKKLGLILSALLDKIPELQLQSVRNRSKAVTQNRFHVKTGPLSIITKKEQLIARTLKTTNAIQINNEALKRIHKLPTSMVNILRKEIIAASSIRAKAVTKNIRNFSENVNVKAGIEGGSTKEYDVSDIYVTSSSEDAENDEEDTNIGAPVDPMNAQHKLKSIKRQRPLKRLDINIPRTNRHRSDPNRDEKTKYEILKRKYNILKHILAQKMKPGEFPIINKRVNEKPAVNIERKNNENEDINLLGHRDENKTTTPDIRGINLFLDYNASVAYRNNVQQKIRQYELTAGYNKGATVDLNDMVEDADFRKSFPKITANTRYNDFSSTTECSVGEMELKRNIEFAIRHTDFKNYNDSSRKYSDKVKPIASLESPETDVEAVLKTNIYKAVKQLLKK